MVKPTTTKMVNSSACLPGLPHYFEFWEKVKRTMEERDNYYMQWFDEILEEAQKNMGSDDDLLPKTPCAKRKGRPRRSNKKNSKKTKEVTVAVDDSTGEEDSNRDETPKKTRTRGTRAGTTGRATRNKSKPKGVDINSEPVVLIDALNNETQKTCQAGENLDEEPMETSQPTECGSAASDRRKSKRHLSLNDSGQNNAVKEDTPLCSTPVQQSGRDQQEDSNTPHTVKKSVEVKTPVQSGSVNSSDEEAVVECKAEADMEEEESANKTFTADTPKTKVEKMDDSKSSTPIHRNHNFPVMNVKDKVHVYEEILHKSPTVKETEDKQEDQPRRSRFSCRRSLKRLSSHAKLSPEKTKPARTRTRLRLKKTQKQPESQQDEASSPPESEANTEQNETKPKTPTIPQVPTAQPVRTRTKTRQAVQSEDSQSESSGHSSVKDQPNCSPILRQSTRTKQRKMEEAVTQKVEKDSDIHTNVPQSSEDPSTPQPRTRTKTRKRHLEEEAKTTEEVRQSKRSCTGMEQEQSHHSAADSPKNQSSEELMSPVCPTNKVVRPHLKSFLNNLAKSNSSLQPANLNMSGVRSFIKSNTPVKKTTSKEMQDKLRKELAEKQVKNEERLQKRNEERRIRIEEMRQRNDVKMRRAQEAREHQLALTHEQREQLEKRQTEKNKITEQVKEKRLREEREKMKIRHQKLQEAEERRKQEEGERTRKNKEQEEEQRQHDEMLRRKKEFEEHERHARIAEENKRNMDRLNELERTRQEDQARMKQIEEERAREWQKKREEREKILINERLEKERHEIARKKEIELMKKREEERLREVERKRLAEEERHQEELRKQEEELKKMAQKHNQQIQATSSTSQPTSNNGSSTLNRTHSLTEPTVPVTSYEMTPNSKLIAIDSYDISDLTSDADTDDDEAPRKRVPDWAQGANLKSLLIKQHFKPPDYHALFGIVDMPDLNVLFEKKKARFNKRTSSAHWTSPIRPFHHRW